MGPDMRDQGSKGWSHEAKSVNPFKSDYTKLNQEKIKNLNIPFTSMEIETVIRNIPAKQKAQDQTASHLNSTKNLEKS